MRGELVDEVRDRVDDQRRTVRERLGLDARRRAGEHEHGEHARFEAGDEKTYLLGSADLMPRNLDHRIEVVMPVEDTHVKNEVESILKTLLADNCQAWDLHSDGTWHRVTPKKSERRRAAQAVLMRRRERARRIARPH